MSQRYEEIDSCPVCGERRFRRLFKKRGRFFWRCVGCGLMRQYPVPSLEEIRAYYETHHTSGRLRHMVEAEEMSRVRAQRRFGEVQPHLPIGRWLDVGCANGTFVRTALDAGNDAEGVEISETAVAAARRLAVPVAWGRIEEHCPDDAYDAITAFDVLEHLSDPISFLENARRLLRERGRLAIAVPDLASMTRQLMGRHWYFYIPDGHLFYYDRNLLRRLVERYGFSVRHIATTSKPITIAYSFTQLRVLNPVLSGAFAVVARVLPRHLAERPIPLRLGEFLLIAEKISDAEPRSPPSAKKALDSGRGPS
jgi:2-polyprenyl-3-methyl-5-hydroxy-6-metoxy-1,4-benzoquinol methylase